MVNGTVNVTWASASTETVTRITGKNGNGKDLTEKTTTLTVNSNLNVSYLDNFDKLVIGEGVEISGLLDTEFDNLQIEFALDGELDTEWTVFAGNGLDSFASATFGIAGVEGTYNFGDAIGSTGYKLEFGEDSKEIKMVKIANA